MSEFAGARSSLLTDVDDVADLYASNVTRVRRLVALDVRACPTVVEDACQVAWARLVQHRARIRRETAVRWVVRVAVNEARHQLRHGARETSLEQLCERDVDTPAAPDLIEELAERRARLGTLRALPPRQRRLLWLRGLGFSYAEMAGRTGDSRRTVERQLARADRRMQVADA